MNYKLIVVLQLVYMVPSLILYSILFCYIAFSRNIEFSCAFYYIFLIRAPADIIQVIVSLITFRLPLAGWEYVLDKPYFAKIGFSLTNLAFTTELFTQLMLSINRFTAVWFPMKHNKWWTLRKTFTYFVCSISLSLVPATVRLFQDAGYLLTDGKAVPYFIHEQDQELNSITSSIVYILFCVSCFSLNAAALFKHSLQRNVKIFDHQLAMARKLQLNLLVYSSAFTLAIISMAVLQSLLAVNAFPVKTNSHSMVIIMLTLSADCFALLNPWLLLALSTGFRSKFLKIRLVRSVPPTSINAAVIYEPCAHNKDCC